MVRSSLAVVVRCLVLLAVVTVTSAARAQGEVRIEGVAFEVQEAGDGKWPRAVRDPRTGIEFLLVQPEAFRMGAPEGLEGMLLDQGPWVDVGLTRPYYLARTETTVAQWRRFVEAHDYTSSAESGRASGRALTRGAEGAEVIESEAASWRVPQPVRGAGIADEHPVGQVSWNDANAFCAAYGYRLPTEAEWELACRAGTPDAYWWGSKAREAEGRGNFADPALAEVLTVPGRFPRADGHAFVAPVASFAPNPFGFHDMLGNVWEWCEDAYDPARFSRPEDLYSARLPLLQDPSARSDDPKSPRVLRGGSFLSGMDVATGWFRAFDFPDRPADVRGFRPAFTPGEAAARTLAPPTPYEEPSSFDQRYANGFRVRCGLRRDAEGHQLLTGRYKGWHREGVLAEEGKLVGGGRRGFWKVYDGGGELTESGTYAQGQRTKEWGFFYPDGTTRAEGNYENGRRTGAWTFKNGDGSTDHLYGGVYDYHAKRDAHGPLLDGARHGRWSFFWPNGMRSMDGGYKRGQRTGAWRFWHPDGTFDPQMISGEWVEGQRIEVAQAVTAGAGDAAARTNVVHGVPLADLAPLLKPARRGKKDPPPVGPADMPRIVGELLALDLAKEADARKGGGLMEELRPLCNGRAFAWSRDVDAGSRASNRLSTLRALSLWLLAADSAAFWKLDVPMPAEDELLFLPPVPVVDGRTGRDPRERGIRDAFGERGEEAVELALAWLAAHQSKQGRWSGATFHKSCGSVGAGKCEGSGAKTHDVGLTALAVMALFEGGNTLGTGPQSDALAAGVRWLISTQQRSKKNSAVDGLIGARDAHDFLYNHALATLALAKVLQRSPSSRLEDVVRKAAQLIVRARNPYAAWRYSIPPNGENDTSITGWMVLALDAARQAGVRVDPACFQGALDWINEATDPATGRVGYDAKGSRPARTVDNQHFPPEKSEANTGVGLHCRLLLGAAPEDDIVQKHADLLQRQLPEWEPESFGCDMYYWFHGTRGMHALGGRHWKSWQNALEQALLDHQRKEGDARGSWDPVGPWGGIGGRVYSTAVLTLCLTTVAGE